MATLNFGVDIGELEGERRGGRVWDDGGPQGERVYVARRLEEAWGHGDYKVAGSSCGATSAGPAGRPRREEVGEEDESE